TATTTRTRLSIRRMRRILSGWHVACLFHRVRRAEKPRRTLVPRLATTLMVLALMLSASAVQAQQKFENSPDARVLGDFKARVEKYDALRKKADDSAPPLEKSNSPEKIKDAQHGLAERIGAARVGVKPGEIFTPEIAPVFKRLLRPEAALHETKEAMKEDKPVVVSFK